VVADLSDLHLEAVHEHTAVAEGSVLPAVVPETLDGAWAEGGVSPPASEHAAAARVSAVTRIGRLTFMHQDCEESPQNHSNRRQRVRWEFLAFGRRGGDAIRRLRG
jgi:hypothetical protein